MITIALSEMLPEMDIYKIGKLPDME